MAAAAAKPKADETDPLKQRLAQSISCHAWNADRTRLAFCPNNKEVHIYDVTGPEWTLEQVLKEHDQLVTGIDWAPKSNRIVTCGQDRNAYVWRYEEGTWKPTLVILRLNRAATDVKWSPNEDKFAVASGAKSVSICYFEQDNDWWVSKHLKKHKSTVLKVDWHPNNILLATSSSDFKARVFSAYVKGIDSRPGETPFGNRLPFGELLGEYPSGGWVRSVRWAPSGNQLAFVSHDSTITFIDVTAGAPGESQVIRLKELPLLDLLFINEGAVVAGGHNNYPRLFERTGNGWVVGRNLDQKQTQAKQAAGTRAAFQMFQNKVEKGEDETSGTVLQTKHQNGINCLQPYKGSSGAYTSVTSTALDGLLCIWNL